MVENTLDIVNFIENNPITKLSNTYQSKILQQIQHELTDEELNIFSTNFYCFLNYHPKNDFIIDLDNVWKWLGFQSKFNSKRILERILRLILIIKNRLLNLKLKPVAGIIKKPFYFQ